ncbi:MAG: nucleoside hydrolase [Lachnospiraceae bacterium]|nr:nucleoside hydrolase [Lachnospiraceae bacterium]
MWNHLYKVPENRKIRYIVHSDAYNEADDQYTIAHALMMDKFDVVGLIGGHFAKSEISRVPIDKTADASYREIVKILDLMDIKDKKVFTGSNYPLENEHIPQRCEAVDFIIEEAMKYDKRPLYIGLQGAITDLASAILIEPEICNRMTAIWVGGDDYPNGGPEFNLRQDINAANVVFSSNMPLWQIPVKAYRSFATSLAELQLKVRPCGKIGKYLFDQLAEFNMQVDMWDAWPHGEMWTLGDEGCIAVLLQDINKDDNYEMVEAPHVLSDGRYEFGHNYRKIRVYSSFDSRLDLEDLFAKLSLNFK